MANAQLHVKFFTNRNGGQNLTLDGYIYRVNRRGTDKTFWRCVVPGCSASLSTVDNIPTGFGTRPHSHPANHTNVVAKQIMNKITKRCKEEVSLNIFILHRLRNKFLQLILISLDSDPGSSTHPNYIYRRT